MLLDCLDSILSGDLDPTDQSSDGVTYDKLITKEDGIIDWNKSWSQIDRQIRAYSIWPRTRCRVSNLEIIVIRAHFEGQTGEPGKHINQDGSLGIYCADGLVIVDELIPAGSKQMSGENFLLGYNQQIF
jgi:methionyl-tRNA formyltransferase